MSPSTPLYSQAAAGRGMAADTPAAGVVDHNSRARRRGRGKGKDTAGHMVDRTAAGAGGILVEDTLVGGTAVRRSRTAAAAASESEVVVGERDSEENETCVECTVK